MRPITPEVVTKRKYFKTNGLTFSAEHATNDTSLDRAKRSTITQRYMKTKTTTFFVAVLATISMAIAPAQAAASGETHSQTLSKLPVIEVPAYALSAVKNADKEAREATAIGLVKVIAVQNETALVPSIASIAADFPALAPAIAKVAAKLAPAQSEQIAQRLSQAAPKFAPQIVAAVAKEVPVKAAKVAVAVQKAVRGIDADIVKTVAQTAPASLPSVQTALQSSEFASPALPGGGTVMTVEGGINGYSNAINPAPAASPGADPSRP